MTVTVAQLIEHLQTLRQDAVVECIEERSGGYDTWTDWKDLTLEDVDYINLEGNQFVKPEDPRFGKAFVRIGCR